MLALTLLLVGCDEIGDTGAPLDNSFSAVQSELLVPSCGFSTCHGSSTGGLTIDGSADDYDRLVGAKSSTGQPYVVPGDADASYLVLKLEGDPSITGDPMPPGSPLPDAEIERVRSWIDGGAPD